MSNPLSEEFVAALQTKILLKDLLKDESFEKQFNSLTIHADRETVDQNDLDKVSAYLIQPEVLADLIDIMINESRSIVEPSLVLQLVLLDIKPLLDAFVSSLSTYFQYLDKKTLNPRRLYFFQRLAQYVFEVRAEKSLQFAISSPDFIRNIVRHLSYAPIVQIFLAILDTDTQRQSTQDAIQKETLLAADQIPPSANAPSKSELLPKIIENLIIAAEEDLPGLIVGLYRFFGALNSNASLLKEIFSTNNHAFIRCIARQLNNPLSVDEAIGLFDDILFKFIMQHESDADFFEPMRACLIESFSISEMLNSDDIKVIIPRLRLIQSIIKNKVNFLVENEPSLFSLISIFYKFPWSNVLHCGITSVYLYILQLNEDVLSKSFLEANLVKEIVTRLGSSDKLGFRSHLRSIVAALHESQSSVVQNILKEDALWPKVLEILQFRDLKIPFPQIELKVQTAFHILATTGTWEDEENKKVKEDIVIPQIEIPKEEENSEGRVESEVGSENKEQEKKEEPFVEIHVEFTEEQIAERERRRLEILEEERRDREQAEKRAQARELRRRESGIFHLMSPRPHVVEEKSILEALSSESENQTNTNSSQEQALEPEKESTKVDYETQPVFDTAPTQDNTTIDHIQQNEMVENPINSSPDKNSEVNVRPTLSLSAEDTTHISPTTVRKYRRCRECFKRAPTPDAVTCEDCNAPFL